METRKSIEAAHQKEDEYWQYRISRDGCLCNMCGETVLPEGYDFELEVCLTCKEESTI